MGTTSRGDVRHRQLHNRRNGVQGFKLRPGRADGRVAWTSTALCGQLASAGDTATVGCKCLKCFGGCRGRITVPHLLSLLAGCGEECGEQRGVSLANTLIKRGDPCEGTFSTTSERHTHPLHTPVTTLKHPQNVSQIENSRENTRLPDSRSSHRLSESPSCALFCQCRFNAPCCNRACSRTLLLVAMI
jgi:hypothetical protein